MDPCNIKVTVTQYFPLGAMTISLVLFEGMKLPF